MFHDRSHSPLSIFRYGCARHRDAKLARALPFVLALALAGCEQMPRVEVRPVNGTTTTEGGATAKWVVWLANRPATSVEVRAVSSNENEGKVSAPVVFDATNYREQQAFYVTGVDDSVHDGDVSYDVDIFARSTEQPDEEEWLVTRLHLVNRDDDVPMFEPITHLPGGATESYASDVSADGSVVVGWSGGAAPDQAFRWTSQGIVGLGGSASRAEAISPDGTKIVGSVADARFEKGRAAASFTAGQPFQLFAGPPVPGPGTGQLLYFVEAAVALDDGTVFGTCIQYAAYGEPLGCKFKTALEQIGGSRIFAADDAHYAGTQQAERHAPSSSYALYDGGGVGYPPQVRCYPYTGCQAAIRDFSAGGEVLVGTSLLPLGGLPLREFALRYSAVEGSTTLPDLEGGELASGAFAISTDGRVIGGYGSDERGRQATLWIDRMPRALEDVLLDEGATLPDGWSLREIRALSRDGRVLVGNGVNPEGVAQAFRVTLRTAP
jgi:probable HAF family extracellular repeat protein